MIPSPAPACVAEIHYILEASYMPPSAIDGEARAAAIEN
jgi:hypothetical protein